MLWVQPTGVDGERRRTSRSTTPRLINATPITKVALMPREPVAGRFAPDPLNTVVVGATVGATVVVGAVVVVVVVVVVSHGTRRPIWSGTESHGGTHGGSVVTTAARATGATVPQGAGPAATETGLLDRPPNARIAPNKMTRMGPRRFITYRFPNTQKLMRK